MYSIALPHFKGCEMHHVMQFFPRKSFISQTYATVVTYLVSGVNKGQDLEGGLTLDTLTIAAIDHRKKLK